MAIVNVFQPPGEAPRDGQPLASLASAPEVTPAALADNLLTEDHMARLGAELFSRHLMSVELAGTLLLVGLVGCVAIVSRMHQPRGGKESTLGAAVSEVVSGAGVTHIGMSGPIGPEGLGGTGSGGGHHV